MPPRLATARAAAMLQSLANPQRLLAVLYLAGGERSVSELLERTQTSPSVLSQHLRVLRDRGIVTRDRRSTEVIYRLEDRVAADIAVIACQQTRAEARDQGRD